MVQAYNGVGKSGWSALSDRIIAALIPSVPLGFAKLSSTTSSITVSWISPLSNGGASIF